MQIFVFGDPISSAAARLSVGDGSATLWSDAVRGVPPPFSLRAQQYMGRQFCDVIWTGLAGTPLISSRVVETLQESGASGWTTYRVDVLDAMGRQMPDYVGLGIAGRYQGRIDFDTRESALIYHTSPQGKSFPYFKGLRFNAADWDGSDLFMDTHGSGWILASERVVKSFRKHKIANCTFRRLQDVELLAQESAILKGA